MPDDRFGLNNLGEVAFTAVINGERHAFVWLPLANYNLPAGLSDLHVLANLDQQNFTASKTHDISAIGIVAGQATTTEGETRAFVWKLGPPLVTIDLSTFASPPEMGRPTDAWAVSDAAQPVVVGQAKVAEGGCQSRFLGFRTTLDGSNVLFTLPPVGGTDDSSKARDVNNASEPFIVGISDAPCVFETPPCAPDRDAVRWEPGVTALVDLGVDQGAEAHGTNNTNQIVGWGYQNPDTPCLSQALFWEPPNYEPVILLADVPQDDARAEAINNLAMPQVVGLNVTVDAALIWENQGGTSWSVTDLNTVINPCADDFDIQRADDINDSGWIIAVADSPPGGGFEAHAVLLTPLAQCPPDCEGDLDNDGMVGILDLLNLLAAWGPCPDPPESCFADLNCSGVVDVFDLLILIANWGKCLGVAGPPPKSLNDELADAGLSQADWDAFKECMSTGTQEQQDNCLCWMQYYLNGCDGGPRQACSDHDPFTDCVGDLNGDCCVNELDTQILLNQMGPCPTGPGACLGDLNGDCVVDRLDHSDLLTHFGACPPTPACATAPTGCGATTTTQLEGAVTQMGFAEVADYQAHISATSEGEAFVCACVLQVLLEAQP